MDPNITAKIADKISAKVLNNLKDLTEEEYKNIEEMRVQHDKFVDEGRAILEDFKVVERKVMELQRDMKGYARVLGKKYFPEEAEVQIYIQEKKIGPLTKTPK